MKHVGFIGLGTMGAPMVANLLNKGFAVTVYNRTASKAEEARALGANVASSPAEAAKAADVLISIISNDQATEEVYYGSNGIFAGLHDKLTIIDCSTLSPGLVKRLASDLAAKGVDFLDAPVTGSKPGAVNGTLLFMIGGKEAAMEAHMDVFQALGTKFLYMGENGSGAVAKLAHNTIVGINNVALAEGFSIAAKANLPMYNFMELIQSGSAGSKAAELKGRKIIEHDFSNQFSLNLMLKDMKLSSQLTDEMQLPTPMLEAAKSMLQMGQTHGFGEEDLSAVAKAYEQWLGKRIGD
ncbi:3-hydroxyisobutyrate dehydrogenase [Paenibacillus selenitireducens]|uniref:3-hydroxyisobutyrate dehydrogenase n=1 Tax=Paenibacillus selenitireducens TaxID=1324314 RepID=A0A1T2XAU4_9BACL|nr:NAD(P)-dependent oxidoreductase [Paenibacillus selenitireducens]OPA76922.1 3-hydroxyisobutyrate dehydrogenase [Paenibacillus selenitireducens]